MVFAPVDVAAWEPGVVVSDTVPSSERLERFRVQAPAGYVAPAIERSPPQEMLVGGCHFAVVAARGGLVDASVHTMPRFRWRQLFEPVARMRLGPGGPALVAAGAGHASYFHWVTETFAAALLNHHAGWAALPLVVPALRHGWQREVLRSLAETPTLIEVAADEALVLDDGVLTSLTGPHHAMAPHPALLAMMHAHRNDGRGGCRRVVYLSRLDAGDRRRMLNEPALCAALAALGCEIVTAGSLGFAAQIALVRDARVIVAPHGAALTNLAFVDAGAAGPAVVELFGDNYLNRCFLRLCQAKRLRYRAVIGPCVSSGVHHHQSSWLADVPEVCRIVEELM